MKVIYNIGDHRRLLTRIISSTRWTGERLMMEWIVLSRVVQASLWKTMTMLVVGSSDGYDLLLHLEAKVWIMSEWALKTCNKLLASFVLMEPVSPQAAKLTILYIRQISCVARMCKISKRIRHWQDWKGRGKSTATGGTRNHDLLKMRSTVVLKQTPTIVLLW